MEKENDVQVGESLVSQPSILCVCVKDNHKDEVCVLCYILFVCLYLCVCEVCVWKGAL